MEKNEKRDSSERVHNHIATHFQIFYHFTVFFARIPSSRIRINMTKLLYQNSTFRYIDTGAQKLKFVTGGKENRIYAHGILRKRKTVFFNDKTTFLRDFLI